MSEEYLEKPLGKTEKIEYLDTMSRIAQLDGKLAWEKNKFSFSKRSMLVWSSNRTSSPSSRVIGKKTS